MASKVYYTDLHTTPSINLCHKLERLVRKAGIEELDCNGKFTAVKIHFGEPGNMAYIRHNYAACIVNLLHALGAKAFLTDSATLYSGRRSNAIDHLRSAWENGFNPIAVPAPVIIADGLKGADYRDLPVRGGTHCKSARIGAAIADADVVVSLTHFKGHEQAGFGGTLKNLGMGAASVGGKLDLHSSSKPQVVAENCIGCRQCTKDCRYGAIALDGNRRAVIDYARCVGCGQCIAACRYEAAQPVWNNSSDIMNMKIAEYVQAIVAGKAQFHVSFVIDVSPNCDCWGSNDVPLVPDIGFAASYDPVALDKACADLVLAAPATAGCEINKDGKHPLVGEDKFRRMHPNTDWRVGLEHAERLGVGTMNYELIKV
ncbi:MAG: DUF362 domain-containing protein [Prevotellaceae bacterium]|jgi:uncharacterized Fe-S center protein|nr:DUF362 domain-containing protein [Prevotellaceae bacterium]